MWFNLAIMKVEISIPGVSQTEVAEIKNKEDLKKAVQKILEKEIKKKDVDFELE